MGHFKPLRPVSIVGENGEKSRKNSDWTPYQWIFSVMERFVLCTNFIFSWTDQSSGDTERILKHVPSAAADPGGLGVCAENNMFKKSFCWLLEHDRGDWIKGRTQQMQRRWRRMKDGIRCCRKFWRWGCSESRGRPEASTGHQDPFTGTGNLVFTL